ncbi:MAG: hypothetical protein KBT68_12280 [bacterium]|nr:hypothetical protein [Candidatus Colisoma equi]
MKPLLSLGAMAAVCLSVGAGTPAQDLKERLLKVGASKSFYWAWTDPWLDRCGAPEGDMRYADVTKDGYRPKALKDTVLQNRDWAALGAVPRIAYTGFEAVAGGKPGKYHQVNRAALAAVVRKAWQDHGGITVFTWHLGSPCVSRRGIRKGAYRYQCPEHPNLVKAILDGTILTRKSETAEGDEDPHLNWVSDPRKWFLDQVDQFGEFVKTLKDENGRPIPIIVRYLHEMDGRWFWWGDGHCSRSEFAQLCRLEADTLRRKVGDGQILFAYTPDRWWRDLGTPEDGGKNFLSWYPGDDYVDVVGFDDYSIGHGKTQDEAKAVIRENLRKMRIVSAFAREHGKVAALTETGCGGARDDFYSILHRLMTSEGVEFAFVDSWHHENFWPKTETGKADMRKFISQPDVLTLRTPPQNSGH